MDDTKDNQAVSFSEIDFSELMDLRVDYAFKLTFGSGDTRFLTSLLNAVFANKKIGRIIKSLTVMNPNLERHSKDDKLSILDIRAQLDDGATVLIEMHLYDMFDLKYKTIRSWARAYGEDLSSGEDYSAQPPVVCVTFMNGQVDGGEGNKIHKCYKIMETEESTVLTDALELHYIDMKAFVKAINKTGSIEIGKPHETMLAKWLAIIAEKDILDKAIIKNICVEQEEIGMAVSALVRLSKDKLKRQEYLKRQDEIMLYNKRLNDLVNKIGRERQKAEQAVQKAEQAVQKAEQERQKAEQAVQNEEQERLRADKEKLRAETAETELKKLRAMLADSENQ